MTTDVILFLAVCAASALVAWASTRNISRPVDAPAPWGPPPRLGGAEAHW